MMKWRAYKRREEKKKEAQSIRLGQCECEEYVNRKNYEGWMLEDIWSSYLQFIYFCIYFLQNYTLLPHSMHSTADIGTVLGASQAALIENKISWRSRD